MGTAINKILYRKCMQDSTKLKLYVMMYNLLYNIESYDPDKIVVQNAITINTTAINNAITIIV